MPFVIQSLSTIYPAENSIVHTDYEKLHNTVLKKDRTILTHGPDRFVSEWPVMLYRQNIQDQWQQLL